MRRPLEALVALAAAAAMLVSVNSASAHPETMGSVVNPADRRWVILRGRIDVEDLANRTRNVATAIKRRYSTSFTIQLRPRHSSGTTGNPSVPTATFRGKVYGGSFAFRLSLAHVVRANAVAYIQLEPHAAPVRPERFTICGWFEPSTGVRNACRRREFGVLTHPTWIGVMRSHGARVVVANVWSRDLVGRITPAMLGTGRT